MPSVFVRDRDPYVETHKDNLHLLTQMPRIWLPVYVNLFFGMALLIIIVYLAFLLSVYGNLNTKTVARWGERWRERDREKEATTLANASLRAWGQSAVSQDLYSMPTKTLAQ